MNKDIGRDHATVSAASLHSLEAPTNSKFAVGDERMI
mgnify:CR=1 FL=1